MIWIAIVWLTAGFVLLIVGAEALVRGASGLARTLGLSPLVIGLTVVAFGTSSPELAVSIKAALSGTGDLAIGNVVGSNIFNVAVILGLSALVAPLAVHFQVIRLDMPIMLAVSVVFVVFCVVHPGISRLEAAILFLGLVAYTAVLFRLTRKESIKAAPTPLEVPMIAEKGGSVPLQALLAVGGLALLVVGAQLLVSNATLLARRIGMSEAVIGLTIVAAGTSLPELATSLVAALKRQTDVAVGNIVGSNLFNLLGVAGLSGVIVPLQIQGVGRIDFAFMLLTSILLLPFLRSGFRVSRWEGAVLVFAYAVYLVLRWPR